MKDHGRSLQSNQQHQQPQDIAPSPGQLFANCLFSNKMTNGFIPSSSEYHKASWRLNHKAKRNLFPTWPVLACLLCSDLLKASRREAACLWGSGWPGSTRVSWGGCRSSMALPAWSSHWWETVCSSQQLLVEAWVNALS